MKHRRLFLVLTTLTVLLGIGFAVPEEPEIPVAGTTAKDWNPKSFWYEPWGASGVHKGIDIFAPQGRSVVSAVPGVVVYQGQLGIGGNVVAVLGPKWRVHYYAHLASAASPSLFLAKGEKLGVVGTSGNAAGKPSHLHYSVVSLIPLPWRFSSDTQGWKRMFFLDPGALLRGGA